jgi:hypothetical protein
MSILANRSITALSVSQRADKVIAATRALQTRPSAYWRRAETNLSFVLPVVARSSVGCAGNAIAAVVVAKKTVDAFARRERPRPPLENIATSKAWRRSKLDLALGFEPMRAYGAAAMTTTI